MLETVEAVQSQSLRKSRKGRNALCAFFFYFQSIIKGWAWLSCVLGHDGSCEGNLGRLQGEIDVLVLGRTGSSDPLLWDGGAACWAL